MSKAEITEILTLLKGLSKRLEKVENQQAMSTETVSNIYQVSEDLSRKFDEMVNVTGIKHPVTSKKVSGKKEKKTKQTIKSPSKSKAVKNKITSKGAKLHCNIMTYFRSKYLENQDYFSEIMDQKETDALFDEHEKDLKNKKGEKKLKAQVGILYKAVSKNKTKMSALRTMMDKENAEHLKSQGKDAVKDTTDDEDEGDVSSESDSDHDE